MTFCSTMPFVIFPLLLTMHEVMAIPFGNTETPFWKRQATGDNSGFQPAIYIPIIVVFVVITVLGVGSAIRKRRIRIRGHSAPNSSGVVEVTANQLTGRTASNTVANAGTSQPRRGRRNRRRASQISVTSLPLYMEEAGDTELVLVRGNRQMDDPISENDPDFLEVINAEDEVNHSTENETAQTVGVTSRRSYDSADSLPEDEEPVTSPLMENHRRSLSESSSQRPQSTESVPAEDAPPYTERSETTASEFREVDLSNDSTESRRDAGGGSRPANESSERPAGTSGSRRLPLRAMPNLRSLFTRTPSETNGNRTLASSSSRTHLLSHQRSNSSFSNHSSMLHLSPTTSRLSSRNFDRSMNASQLSLASISAPLQHTLVKTEFNYPKNGPTQEQMKFLGSRESLALFGVPFGSAAVAYSRVEPPPFEVSSGQADSSQDNGSQTPGQEVGHSRDATDETIVPSNTAPTQPSAEPIQEETPNSQDIEISTRVDPHLPASPTTPSGTAPSSGFVTASATGRDAEEGTPGTPKMAIPITIVREPSPTPATLHHHSLGVAEVRPNAVADSAASTISTAASS